MTLKIIGFIIRVLKMAYDTFVESKPAVKKPVRPIIKIIKPPKRLWLFGAAILAMAGLVIFLKWFFQPLEPVTEVFEIETPDAPPDQKEIDLPEFEDQPKSGSDDLTRIKGIGQKSAALLAEHGITTYAMLAQTPTEDLVALIRGHGNRITNPKDWSRQAAFAAEEDWDGLKAYLAEAN